jgi:hypothetical protein
LVGDHEFVGSVIDAFSFAPGHLAGIVQSEAFYLFARAEGDRQVVAVAQAGPERIPPYPLGVPFQRAFQLSEVAVTATGYQAKVQAQRFPIASLNYVVPGEGVVVVIVADDYVSLGQVL